MQLQKPVESAFAHALQEIKHSSVALRKICSTWLYICLSTTTSCLSSQCWTHHGALILFEKFILILCITQMESSMYILLVLYESNNDSNHKLGACTLDGIAFISNALEISLLQAYWTLWLIVNNITETSWSSAWQ